MSEHSTIDLEEVPNWPDLIVDPAQSTVLYGSFVTDAIERLKLVEEMERLVEGAVNRMEEGLSATLDFTDESLESIDRIIGQGFREADELDKPIAEVIDDLV